MWAVYTHTTEHVAAGAGSAYVRREECHATFEDADEAVQYARMLARISLRPVIARQVPDETVELFQAKDAKGEPHQCAICGKTHMGNKHDFSRPVFRDEGGPL